MSQVTENKWQPKDSLRSMTDKFNTTVDALEELKNSSKETNQATEQKFTELGESLEKQFKEVNDEITKKVSEVSADDIGLGKVNNTPDSEKPVSSAQQEAINQAKQEALQASSDMLTSAESYDVETTDNDEPELSPVIKAYIDRKLKEMAALSVVDNFGIAQNDTLGVVKASDQVNVDPTTGKMSIPQLEELTQTIQTISERWSSINPAISKIGDKSLATDNKTIIGAINELYELIKSIKQ